MSETIRILDGSTFCVSDRHGDIDAGPDQLHGFFYRDTRFLSFWRLRIDGQPLELLSSHEADYFAAHFYLVPEGRGGEAPRMTVMRKRFVGEGLHEDIVVLNHAREPIELELEVEADSDFADLFEVKQALTKKGERYCEQRGAELVLGYRREQFVRETRVHSTADAEITERGLRYRIEVAPGGEWTTCLVVTPVADVPANVKYAHGEQGPKPNIRQSLEEWLAGAPELECDWDALRHIYERALVDLAALRFYPLILPDASLPAAGLPWYMSLFGRDSLITSYQTLPFVPELASTTLRVLAARQATEVDDFRDAEPGKILHELRFGELVAFDDYPQSPYYGTADATPLFLVLLDETERWTGDGELVRELEPNARAALEWIDRYGDGDRDRYVEYESRNGGRGGLENHGWKDSWNAILFPDGSLARPPIATCEIQGYVYDAKLRSARVAREFWNDVALAERLEREARELKRRFNEDFWLPERAFYALALDGEKRPVDTLTSNIGHLLWSGIADEDKAEAVVRHLMDARLFSGWGIRTMAEGEGGYNPVEYHNGTVWPHDNSLIAAGLARYGYREEAARLAAVILEAATHFRHRLPEAFAGYARDVTSFPVAYPTASSPQAWATGAALLLLRVVLGLEPDGDRLRADPALPGPVGELRLRRIPGRWGRTEVLAARGS